MRHHALRFTPIVLATLSWLLAVAPALANIDLAYFELVQGADPTEVNVLWGTETEVDVAGFLIKRGVNANLAQAADIHSEPARGSAISGYDYSYTDIGLTPGQVYHYWLVALTTDGQQVVLTSKQITAGGAPSDGAPRSFMPLVTLSTTGRTPGR